MESRDWILKQMGASISASKVVNFFQDIYRSETEEQGPEKDEQDFDLVTGNSKVFNVHQNMCEGRKQGQDSKFAFAFQSSWLLSRHLICMKRRVLEHFWL